MRNNLLKFPRQSMARANNEIKSTTKQSLDKSPRRGAKPQVADKSKKVAENTPLLDTNHKETSIIIGGFALLLVSVYLSLSCVSHLFTSVDDQNIWGGAPMSLAENWGGGLGSKISTIFMEHGFGIAFLSVIVFIFVLSLKMLGLGHIRIWKWFLNCSIILIWGSCALHYFFGMFTGLVIKPGGAHGEMMIALLKNYVGSVGTFLLIILALTCYLAYISGETVRIIKRMMIPLNNMLDKRVENNYVDDDSNKNETKSDIDKVSEVESVCKAENVVGSDEVANIYTFEEEEENNNKTRHEEKEEEEINNLEISTETISTDCVNICENKTDDNLELIINESVQEEEAQGDTLNNPNDSYKPYDPKLDLEHYKYPTLDLLDQPADTDVTIDKDEQTANKNRIIEVLRNFGIEISNITATIGPTITLYEITPAVGVRIAKIRNLEDDIALSLAALGIRIIAPIPGKGTIGIEVPNEKKQIVPMASILNSKRFKESDYELPCAIGKTITNEVYMIDLAKMPHLLVAGATGQGKSVGLNAIVTSLLYKKHPAELKIVMVDPKKVEFSVYQPLVRHFLAQVEDENEDDAIITDVRKVVATLNSLCAEMDARYDLLKKVRVRNIKEYNAKFKARQLNPNNGHRFLPYIVVIIDEFGDLIMTAGKEVELPIARIAQLARAVGIHMIIATQRPTTNIITGTIKANFPARMAFKVSAMIDSRTILDRPGANQLIGRGDMLFLAGSEPVRVQCAFVDTPEVERITAFIAKQQSYTTSFQLPRVQMENDSEDGPAVVDTKSLDPLFDDVARLIVSTQQGSTSMIQRKLSLGYNRAGRLMDQMEAAGIVGPSQGSKPREVLVHDEITLDRMLNDLH